MIYINVKAVKLRSLTPNRWASSLPGYVCPFPGQLIKHRWREVFWGKMGIRKVKDGFLLLSASVLSLWRSPQATWHFNKMLNCTINTSAAGRTRALCCLQRLHSLALQKFLCSGWPGTTQVLWEILFCGRFMHNFEQLAFSWRLDFQLNARWCIEKVNKVCFRQLRDDARWCYM